MANQVDFKILPSDQFNVYSPQTRSDKIITYFTLLSKLRGDILAVGGEDDPNDIVSAFYTNTGGTQTLHLVKADGSEITASQAQQVISGTLNYVSKFTSSNDIGNSQIFDDGTNVGIGTTSMTHKLQLATGGVFADYFQLDTTYSNGFVVGAISWDSDNGTADIGLSGSLKLKIGQDDVWYVKNQTGSTITKGTAVYASGTLGASSRITIAPMIANGTIPARFFLGIVAETIANGADGYVLARGKIRQISTLAYNEGDVLWVSPTTAGALTATEPTAPNLKLPVAFVVYKASNGVLAVRATTGTKIADASDVDYTGAVDNSFLVYDSATGVWEDEAVGIFKTIAVASQDSIVADSYTDTLNIVAGTGISLTTAASTDTLTITNSAPDQVVSLTGAGTTVITGTYPSFTITSNDEFDGTVTSVAALTLGTSGTDLSSTVANSTTTPVITLNIPTASATNRGALSSADWTTFNSKEPALTKGNLTEATSSVLTITNGTNAVIGSGTTIQVAQSGAASDGYLSSADWTSFNSKQDALTFTAPLVDTSGTITITQSGAATDGYLSSTDWTTFNDKEPALTKGDLTEATSAVLTITNGTNAVIGTGTTIQVAQASSTASGYLSSTDWTTFNGKQGALTFTAPLVNTSGTITITQSGAATDGYLSSADWTTFNGKQNAITLTTTGTSGAATLVGSTLNIPDYTEQYTGTVTSVNLTAGTGISVSGGPITTSGSITVTNTAPDQTVSLTAGTGIGVTGTYPSFTITNTAATSISCFSGYSSTGITLAATATAYDLTLDVETVKDATVFSHSTITNSDEVTVLAAGTYEISYSGTLYNANSDPDSAAAVVFELYKNATAIAPLNTAQTVSHVNVDNYNYINQVANSYILTLAANDVIKLSITANYQAVGPHSPAVIFGFVAGAKNNLTIKKIG